MAHDPEQYETLPGPSLPDAVSFTPDTLGSAASPDAPSMTASVPGFEILSELGRGGMGIVYLARQTRYPEILAVIYFVPLLLSSAALAITYKALLDPNFGLGPGLKIPLLTQDWLGRDNLALGVVVFVVSWQFIPFHSLIYQSGVRQIPKTLYEASEIDGAGRVRQFFSITLPQLKYTVITSSTLMVVGSLTFFDLIFVLTAGGPGDATRALALDMYKRGFQANLMGPASAIAVILVLVGLALALLLRRLGGRDAAESQMEGA